MVMLTLGEARNMGLSTSGFQPGRIPNFYGRESYGMVGGNVGLQHSLSDLMPNTSLQEEVVEHQCAVLQDADILGLMNGRGYGTCMTSMGFWQPSTGIDRGLGLLEDVLPQVIDQENHYNAPVSTDSSLLYGSIPRVGLGETHVGISSVPLQHQVAREQWVEGIPTARQPVERDVGLSPVNLKPCKIIEKQVKSKRPSEQVDHILRERQRRDDMTSKFAILESLLPIGLKRDRSTIVDDSIVHVKNLHHRIQILQQRRLQLQQAVAVKSVGNIANGCRRVALKVLQPYPVSPSKLQERPVATPRSTLPQEELSKIHSLLRNCLEKIEVHADLPHQVVIELVCRHQPRLQSNILQYLEHMNLDITHCCITKVAHRLVCVITAKPVETTMPTNDIVAALKNALGSDEAVG